MKSVKRKFRDEFNNSYLMNKSYGLDNSTKPAKPKLTFCKDIFAEYVNILSSDVYNDFFVEKRGVQEWTNYTRKYNYTKSTPPRKSDINIRRYRISDYSKENTIKRIQLQSNSIRQIESVKGKNNFNVEKILGEARLYLQKVSK